MDRTQDCHVRVSSVIALIMLNSCTTPIDQHKLFCLWVDALQYAENRYKERAIAITHKMATQTNATEQTLHNTLNGQQLTTHTGRHWRRNTNTPGLEEHSAIWTLGTSCSKQGEQQWAKETVFIGGEYCGKTVSGLKTVFIGGEYWGTTVSGLKTVFYWRLKTDIRREPPPLHKMATQTNTT